MTILSKTHSPSRFLPLQWSFSYHSTLYHLPQQAFTSEYRSIWQIQFFSLLQITSMRLLFSCSICSTSSLCFLVSPADLFYLPPHTYLSIQSLGIFFLI